MLYNEQLANEIIVRYNLTLQTKVTWKHRNNIPERYIQEEQFIFRKGGVCSPKDVRTQKRILEILQNKRLNRNFILKSLGFRETLICDVGKGMINFRADELLALQKYIHRLRIEIKGVIEECNRHEVYSGVALAKLKKLLNREDFHVQNLVEKEMPRYGNKGVVGDYGRLMRWKNNQSAEITQSIFTRTVDALVVMALELSI